MCRRPNCASIDMWLKHGIAREHPYELQATHTPSALCVWEGRRGRRNRGVDLPGTPSLEFDQKKPTRIVDEQKSGSHCCVLSHVFDAGEKPNQGFVLQLPVVDLTTPFLLLGSRTPGPKGETCEAHLVRAIARAFSRVVRVSGQLGPVSGWVLFRVRGALLSLFLSVCFFMGTEGRFSNHWHWARFVSCQKEALVKLGGLLCLR